MFSLPRILIGGTLAVVVIAAIAVGGWWFFIREDAKLATNSPAIPADLRTSPTALAAGGTPSTTVASGAASTAGGGQTFTILSDRSEAAYFADEKLASLPLPSKASGKTSDITGSFHLTADGLNLDPSTPSTFTVNLTTIKSDKSMRDSRVQSQGLETSKYPTATFTATKVTGYDPSIAAGDEQSMQLIGMLDLHGVKKEVTWDLKARRDAGVMTALATLKFNFADFNIAVLNIANFVSVEDAVTLQVQVVAQQS